MDLVYFFVLKTFHLFSNKGSHIWEGSVFTPAPKGLVRTLYSSSWPHCTLVIHILLMPSTTGCERSMVVITVQVSGCWVSSLMNDVTHRCSIILWWNVNNNCDSVRAFRRDSTVWKPPLVISGEQILSFPVTCQELHHLSFLYSTSPSAFRFQTSSCLAVSSHSREIR